MLPSMLQPWLTVGLCGTLQILNTFMLYTLRTCCYTYSMARVMSTQNDYHRCLEKLTTRPPKRKAALVRSLLPGIEAALSSGQTLKDIWHALKVEGLPVSYHTFQMAVWRAKRKRTTAGNWEKRQKPSDARSPEPVGLKVAEERDPLANLRRLEENRPGFQWRGTQRGQKVVQGKEDSNGEKRQ